MVGEIAFWLSLLFKKLIMRTFFTSDTHFGHKNIIDFCDRPFINTVDMREKLIQNWNSVVRKDDTVYHLGDFAYKASPQYIIEILERLNGDIHLIIGNHDGQTLKAHSICNRFTSISDYGQITIQDDEMKYKEQIIILSHYPFITWNHKERGSWQLFGHVHNRKVTDNPAQLDVGVDSHSYHPIDYKTVKTLITKAYLNYGKNV